MGELLPAVPGPVAFLFFVFFFSLMIMTFFLSPVRKPQTDNRKINGFSAHIRVDACLGRQAISLPESVRCDQKQGTAV